MKIVFIHGLTGSKHNFDYLVNHFPETQTFDLPGHGDQKKPRVKYDSEFFCHFLKSHINQRVILVGHSLGAILAKEFALKYANLVEHLFLISYPIQKSQAKTLESLKNEPFALMYVKKNVFMKILCHSKIIWKWPLLFWLYLTRRKYYKSFRDYFKHTYQALISTIDNVILKDDYKTLKQIKSKTHFIIGENDQLVDKKLLQDYRVREINGMGHLFFGYEKEIASIILDVAFE